jgi:hypothetical protein
VERINLVALGSPRRRLRGNGKGGFGAQALDAIREFHDDLLSMEEMGIGHGLAFKRFFFQFLEKHDDIVNNFLFF